MAAGQTLGGEREQTLFERIEAEVLRYWTSTGREKASGDGPSVPRLRKVRDDAVVAVSEIADRITSLESRAIRAAELSETIASAASSFHSALSGSGAPSRRSSM